MRKRWILRILAFVPPILCIILWVWSYITLIAISRASSASQIGLANYEGHVVFIYVESTPPRAGIFPIGWHFYSGQYRHTSDPDLDAGALGFKYSSTPIRAMGAMVRHFLMIPYWLPTLLTAALAFITWRMTRPHPIAGAFPITTHSTSTDPPAKT